MATFNFTTFSNNTVADANAVTTNFQNIKNFVESQTVQVDGSVKATTASIADDAVTAAKIAPNAVGTSEIANDAVTADKVADGATLPVNITGNAATANSATNATNAGYATSSGNADYASNAGNLSNGGATFNWNGGNGRWETGQSIHTSGAINVFSGLNVYASQIYYGTIPSSASTNYIVQRSDGILCYRSGTSLAEYKENIKPLSNALELVKKLKPKSFVFKEEYTDMSDPFEVFARRTQRQYGFVVDDILEIDSDFIDHDYKDGEMVPRMWKHEAILANAVAAIQELSDKVDALQAELDALKNV